MQDTPDYDYDAEDEGPSKSQRKREHAELQELGSRLLDLNEGQLLNLALEADLHEAVMLGKRLKQREARRRQLQYIGKLMRKADVDSIRQTFADLDNNKAKADQVHHKAEQWRDRILENKDNAVEAFLEATPTADRQQLRNLLRSCQKELAKPQAGEKTQQRKLFRYLRDCLLAAI